MCKEGEKVKVKKKKAFNLFSAVYKHNHKFTPYSMVILILFL